MTVDVVAVPGGVMPAAERYRHLAGVLGHGVRLHTKDLEVYAGPEPPADYSIAQEVEALSAFAGRLALDRFHLLGYSGGGYVSLAFAGAHPERLQSLALFEPAAIPGAPTAEEAALQAVLERGLVGRSDADFMRAFTSLQLRPGVTPPPPPEGPPPPWMRSRPAGLAALIAAFAAHQFDRGRLRECDFPVFFGYGDETGEHEEVHAAVLARLLPDLRVRRFAGVHHFVAAERIYSPEHVAALRILWS